MPRIDNNIFYSSSLKKYGTTPQGVNWFNETTQQKRFEVIFSLLPKNLSLFTLVDAGCGFGDFYTYLSHNNNLPKKYIGIDMHKKIANIAKIKTSQSVLNFDLTNTTPPKSDYVVCSGALNILTPYETFNFLKNCFEATSKLFIFNALFGEKQSDTYNYISKKTILEFAMELDVSDIKFIDNYLDNDITVGFYK